MSEARFVVGIDLGTTNCALAWADTRDPERRVRSFPVPQLVAEGRIEERPTLPSFLYLGGGVELPREALALPWAPERTYAVGEFAREQGARVPARLVSSAKSWLCHGGVDRDAPILPWIAPEDVPRISPVDAAARYLEHLRETWDRAFPDAPLAAQDVVLTVPASFDEVARELTVKAATRAGLPRFVLLEEPQAAFYAWIQAHESRWEEELCSVRLALVVDIGGGTTDFSLIAVRQGNAALELQRMAVGEHLLLGGDNIDTALARRVEPRLGTRLDSQRWHALTNACRRAKELLLEESAPEEVAVRLVGRGAAVVGGTVQSSVSRRELEEVLFEGFFPLVPPDARPRKAARSALQEWGLPFATDAEIPRHLAAFLAAHRSDDAGQPEWPDAVLFNGGALKPRAVRERLTEQLAAWRGGEPPRVLANPDLDLAVARGAAYYGLVRRGMGVRIGGGSPRAYYLGLEPGVAGPGQLVRAVCIVPRGLHEGEEVEISGRDVRVITNRPVSFPLYASSVRLGDRPGAVITGPREEFAHHPPIRTVLRFGKKLVEREIPARLVAYLTELGTLEVWLRSLETEHRWRLEFDLRDALGRADAEEDGVSHQKAELAVDEGPLEAAATCLRSVFPEAGEPLPDADPVGLVRRLEEILGAGKDAWSIGTIRRLWEVLWQGRAARGRDPRWEARWLNLCGFFLRPGFGDPMDAWRIEQVWRIISEGLHFPRDVQCRVEWWNLWRRIAGGLSRAQQRELFNQTAPWVLPRLKGRRKGPRSAVGPQELRQYWQLLGACERLPADLKVELGETLLPRVASGKAGDAEVWALGRIGSRAPLYGPVNCVVPADVAAKWLERLLQRSEKLRSPALSLALLQLARCTGDRQRDLDEALRRRLAEWLRARSAPDRAVRMVLEPLPLETAEQGRILDESLPVGFAFADA